MTADEMKQLTKQFAIDIGKFVVSLERNEINKNYSSPLIRSSSSVAANYRAVRRAKSKADFINKLKIVEEELDESMLFLELLKEFNANRKSEIEQLHNNVNALLKIIVATIITTRNK